MVSLRTVIGIKGNVMKDLSRKKRGISAVQASEKLKIKAVTLRKYSLIVENELNDKLKFRNEINKNRVYSMEVITRFKKSIILTKNGFVLSDALKIGFDSQIGNKSDQQRILCLEERISQLADRISKLEEAENKRTQRWWKR